MVTRAANSFLQGIATLGAAYRTYCVRHHQDGLGYPGYPQDDRRHWVVIDLADGKIVDRFESSEAATARARVLDAARHHA